MALSVTTSASFGLSLGIEPLSQTAGKPQHFLRARGSCSHQRAPHYHSVSEFADRPSLIRRRDAETYTNRKLGRCAKTLDDARQIRGSRFLYAGDTKPADKVNESTPVPGDLFHPVTGSRGRHQPNEGQWTVTQPFFAHGIRAYRNISDQNSARARV